MKHQKILNLLNEANDSKFVTKNETLSMIIQNQTMLQQRKLHIKHKF